MAEYTSIFGGGELSQPIGAPIFSPKRSSKKKRRKLFVETGMFGDGELSQPMETVVFSSNSQAKMQHKSSEDIVSASHNSCQKDSENLHPSSGHQEHEEKTMFKLGKRKHTHSESSGTGKSETSQLKKIEEIHHEGTVDNQSTSTKKHKKKKRSHKRKDKGEEENMSVENIKTGDNMFKDISISNKDDEPSTTGKVKKKKHKKKKQMSVESQLEIKNDTPESDLSIEASDESQSIIHATPKYFSCVSVMNQSPKPKHSSAVKNRSPKPKHSSAVKNQSPKPKNSPVKHDVQKDSLSDMFSDSDEDDKSEDMDSGNLFDDIIQEIDKSINENVDDETSINNQEIAEIVNQTSGLSDPEQMSCNNGKINIKENEQDQQEIHIRKHTEKVKNETKRETEIRIFTPDDVEKAIVSAGDKCDILDVLNNSVLSHRTPKALKVLMKTKPDLFKGHPKMMKGYWQHAEVEQLEKNFNAFVKEHNVTNPYDLLKHKALKKGPRKSYLMNLIRRENFYIKLAFGIRRTLYCCYVKARTMFHPLHHKGRMSDENIKKLKVLQNEYGNKWTVIGEKLDHSGWACVSSYRSHCSKKNQGIWSKEEEIQLVQAIKDELETEDIEDLFYGLPWESIAARHPTRDPKQCAQKWGTQISFKGGLNWIRKYQITNEEKIQIITRVYECHAYCEGELDWESMHHEHFKESIPSPMILQRQWFKLKSTVPQYKIKDFQEICDYLHNSYLPRLKATGTRKKSRGSSGKTHYTSNEFISDSDSDSA